MTPSLIFFTCYKNSGLNTDMYLDMYKYRYVLCLYAATMDNLTHSTKGDLISPHMHPYNAYRKLPNSPCMCLYSAYRRWSHFPTYTSLHCIQKMTSFLQVCIFTVHREDDLISSCVHHYSTYNLISLCIQHYRAYRWSHFSMYACLHCIQKMT